MTAAGWKDFMENLWLKIKIWTKIVIFTIVVIYLVIFTYNNSDQPLTIWLWFGKEFKTSALEMIPALAAGRRLRHVRGAHDVPRHEADPRTETNERRRPNAKGHGGHEGKSRNAPDEAGGNAGGCGKQKRLNRQDAKIELDSNFKSISLASRVLAVQLFATLQF